MRVVRCTACGHAASMELSRCPHCRTKNLVFHHTFSTSPIHYQQLLRSAPKQGSHPLVSLALVTLLTTGFAWLLFCWMFPAESVLPLPAPKKLALQK